ncbi:myb-like protein X isoform X3 [Osmia bicornis bicornis]|uniref:myb-like protein X isoform X3 n=1 Tax=Osmia bicornis bicornis TaxID=1437191 RepID=UPI001EAEAE6D|nr:myb-like protein X isoform X3 [Osmia bicornis bicornis]
MPRSTRDSEEEVDPKPGRKTRLTDVVSVDSPLRRSSRIKSVKQNESSPESLSSDTSNVSNTQTKVTRRRTGIMDNTTTTEKQRSLRSRMNSGSLDVSEVTENGTNTMTPTKRNRNSITGDVLNKTNNRRSTQFTRAGSESKTSPIRVTRNTRSTSMEPESVAVNKYMDKNESECVHTSSRMRRRTLVVPSEATVVEEKEENMKVVVVKLDRTLPNVSEVKEMDLNDPLKSAQKHDPMSSAEDNLNSSCQSLNEKSIENSSVKELPNNIAEKLKEEESANDSSTLKNKPTKESESNEQKSESIQETCNKDQGSEPVEETPTELKEVPIKEELKEEESTNDLSTLKKKLTEKSGSDEQKSESIQETCNKNQESEAVESNDSDKIATNLFQDIPDVEWKEKNSAKSTNTDGDSVTDVVKSSAPFTVTETPTELDEEVTKKEELKEKEFANDSSTLKNKPTEKSGSDEQKSESIQETCNKNKGSEAVESNDSDTTATDLFQDIPAAEWNEKNTDVDKNSIHLVSTEQLENEMEAECDLVLIDKEASENMKAAREKEASDYDSDESVVLKLRLDSVIAQKNEKTKMNKSVDKMNDSKDATSNENDIDNETTNTKDLDEIENKNQDTSITEQRTEHSASSRKLRERKRSNESHKITEAEENLSESITKKQKPLNKSTSKADVSRKSLNKSIQKEMESESTSAKKSKEKQSLNISSKKQRSCIEESDTEAKDSSISEKKSNAKKKFSRKRSTIRTIQSNSDDNNSESGDSANIELPKFMLDEASNTGSNESDKSMDSDIEKEYNLGGKDTSKFSDDDVRGDECRASETESSDPEDNGSDLEDFIVDDVEEDEESEEEGEKANEKIEIEELHTDENTRENQEKEIKEQDEAMQVQEPDVIEDKIKEGITEEELQNENEQENIEDVDKLINTSSKQKSKLEISDRLSRSQTNRKKKLKKVDTSQSEKSEKENNLSDLSLKQKVLSVADNILEVDRQKKRKKRKQSAEKNNTTILIEDSFLEDIDSQIVSKDKNVVSTIDADKNKKVEKVFLNEKKKRQKITHTDINKDVEEEVLHEEITDTKTKITKKPKKIKKKQEKEITENVPDICSGNQVLGKKKKKISEPLLNEEITTTRISKKTPKLSKDIVLQDDETAVEQLPKKKKKLLSKDASSQEKVLAKTLDKKQNLSSNDTSQNKNISAEKLSKKQNKLVEKVANSEVKPVKKSIKLQQSVSDSNEGPTIVKFSEVREEALKAVKRITDGIKVTKEKKNKKQKERMQEVELENEKPKSKKQKIIDNKTTSTKGIKRLSDEFLENLSDVPSKPLKKKKLSEIKNQTLPSRSMFDSRANKVENVYVEEDFDTVSSYGGTTQFAVENIQKMKKKKKIPGVVSFKQKMIARNSRQPVSAYLMYLEKQKIAGKDTFCNKPY